jgi:predicted DNA binding CopG/RHH family protein
MLLYIYNIVKKYKMKEINRDKHIQVRFTESEIVKFKQVAKENGLTLSGFARYSMARASIILNAVKKEL